MYAKNGKTLLIDLLNCNKDTLENITLLFNLLITIPPLIHLTPITAPSIVKWEYPQCKVREDWGYSGGVIFAESHCKFHTWPEKGLINLDITSCKDFDYNLITKLLCELFKSKDIEYHVIARY